MKHNVLIIDDHPTLLLGLSLCISSIEGFEVVERTGFNEQEITQIKANEYSLVVIDYRLKTTLGSTICKTIKTINPQVKTILISGILDASFLSQVKNIHIDGLLSKQANLPVIEEAIAAVLNGEVYHEQMITDKLANGLLEVLDKVQSITKREKEIIQLLIQGMSNKAIAQQLFISTKTVESHKNALKQKLNVNSINELLVFCSKYSEIILGS